LGCYNLLPILSECEVTSEDESKCDMPIQDQSSSVFTIFSNPLFKDNDNLTSSDDESLFEEDVPIKESKVYSNPLFDDDEINSDELESHEEIRLIENLLYDNSSPRPLEELNAEITNTIVESFPSLPIPVQDGDVQREEIDIFTETNDVDNSIPLTEDGSSDSDHQDDPSFPRPPLEPPDAEFDFKPDSEEEISVVMNDYDELGCLDPRDENDKDDDYFPFMFVIQIFCHILSVPRCFFLFSPLRVRIPSLTLDLPPID
nr:hypothetical protein [Tanacetum cinerariifolium]